MFDAPKRRIEQSLVQYSSFSIERNTKENNRKPCFYYFNEQIKCIENSFSSNEILIKNNKNA